MLVLAASASTPAFAKRKGARRGSGAHAAPRKRIAVMPAAGSEGADSAVRARIRKALTKNKIKVASKPKDSAPSDDQGWMALARALAVDGFIVPTYQGDKSQRSVEIAVRTASNGSVVKSATFTAKGTPKKLAAAVRKGFWKELGSAVEQVSAPTAGQEGTGMPARDLSHETASASETEAAADAAPEPEPAGSEPATESPSPATESSPASGEPPGATADEKPPEPKAEDGAASEHRPRRHSQRERRHRRRGRRPEVASARAPTGPPLREPQRHLHGESRASRQHPDLPDPRGGGELVPDHVSRSRGGGGARDAG